MTEQPPRIVFVDAAPALAAAAGRSFADAAIPLAIHRDPDVQPAQLPSIVADASIALVDHSLFPTPFARACPHLRHIVFLGTGIRSCMSPEELADAGISTYTISGYGDVAVAEMTIALMFAAARSLAAMDRALRAGRWQRTDGLQLTGKTLGLIGFGGIAREVARLASFMHVLAWNRTPRTQHGVEFVDLDTLVGESDVVSLHLALNDATRGFLSAARLAQMRPGAVLLNTARGALVDEAAMIERLRSGALAHAGLDVYALEPLPPQHPLLELENVTLSAHSAFRTPEATETLVCRAREIVAGILAAGR